MSIIQTVDFNLFKTAFSQANREDQFSYIGLQLLWDILASYYYDTDENIEMDVIGLCCEFSESSLKEFIGNYKGAEDNFNEAKQDLVCGIEGDQDYIESIDNIMYDVVTEYLNYAGGLYMISDCRTILVYQNF